MYGGLGCPGIGLLGEESGRMMRGEGAESWSERWEGMKSLGERL